MTNSLYKKLSDEELLRLKEFTEWMIDFLLKNGVARDDLHKRVDDILGEMLDRLGH